MKNSNKNNLTIINYLLPVLILLLFIFGEGISLSAYAQTFQWAKQMGGTSSDIGYSIAIDGIGNVYVTGSFEGTADFDPGAGISNLASAGGDDIFFAKYDSGGNYLWAKNIGSTSYDGGKSIAVDGTGNVYVTGYFSVTPDFDPGVGTSNLSSNGAIDIFFAKYDASGNYLWAKSIGTSSYDEGKSIAVDVSGNVYVTGYFRSTADFDPGAGTSNLTSAGNNDIFFAKYDASGNYLWAKSIGSSNYDHGYSIAVDGTSNVYITGDFEGAADFDPGIGTSYLTFEGMSDIFFAKYDSSGNYIWAKSIGGPGADGGNSIAVDGTGNVYVTGDFEYFADFDPGIGTSNLTSSGDNDIFFAKYDSSGNYIWAKNIGSTSYDGGNSIAVGGTGNVYVTGYFRGTADFDPGAGTSNLTSEGVSDLFFAKYYASGNYLWAKSIGSSNFDNGYSIAVDGTDNVYVIGKFELTADFDPGAGTYNLTAEGIEDIFIFKLAQPPCLSVTSTQTNVSCNGENNGSATVTASGGTLPYTYKWSNGASTQNISLLQAGLYVLTLLDADSCSTFFEIQIYEPAILSVNFTSEYATSPATNDGSIKVSVGGGTPPYTYRWSTGATTNEILNLSSGNYSVTVTDNNGCSKEISDIFIGTLTIVDIQVNDIMIYPNPVNKLLYISFNKPIQNQVYLEIRNLLGEVIIHSVKNKNASTAEFELDVSTLQNGLYFLSIQQEDSAIIQKILKQK